MDISNPNPIFPDFNIRPHDYNKFEDNLLVTRVFPTIQGEGPFAGQRAVFVRLAGCNLGGKGVNAPGCSFCDTDFRFHQGTIWNPEGLILIINEAFHYFEYDNKPIRRNKLVVVTGGEPMLQKNLVSLIHHGTPLGFSWQIESNGTLLLEDLPSQVYLVVSPKVLEHPSLPSFQYYQPQDKVLKRANCLKFVVSSRESSPYHHIPKYAFDFDGPVFVSPMAVYRPNITSPNKAAVSIWSKETFDQHQCAMNHVYAAELAQKYGFIMSVQMHLYCGVE